MAKFQQLETAVKSLDKEVKNLTSDLQQLINLVNQNSKSQSELAAKTNQLKDTTDSVSKLEKERINLLKKLKDANSDRIQKNEELRVQLQKQKKVNKDLAREKLGLIGAYEKEARKLNDLRKKYKDVAIQYGENSKQAIVLRNEITKLDGKLKKIDSSVGQHQRNVGNYKKAWTSLTGAFAVVTGAIASARIAIKGIGNVINSTQATGDRFQMTIQGMKSAYDAFNKSLASGDLKNVFQNMKEAFQAGKDYAAMLDDLGDRERDLKVTRSEANVEIQKLTNAVQNVTLADEKRIEAAKKIFEIEKNLLNQTQSVREQDFEAQRDLVAALTGLEKERILEFVKNYDEEKDVREQAIKLIEAETKSEQLKQSVATQGRAISQIQIAQFEELDRVIQSSSETVRAYAAIYRNYAKTTDDELNKVVDSYVALQDAESSSISGLRRITNQYNTLVKKISAGAEEAQKSQTASVAQGEAARTKIILGEQLERIEGLVPTEQESIDELLLTWEEFYNKKKDLRDADAEDESEKRQENIDNTVAALDFISETTNAVFDLQQANRQSEIDNLLAQKDAEIAAAERTGKSTAAIEKKYAKKEQQLRTEQAKAEKRKALFDIAIATAVAIAKSIPNPVLIALSAALGAVQLATVAAKPIPKFKTGTKGKLNEGTFAVVGDGFEHELITTPQGDFLSDNKPQTVWLPKNSEVFSGADTKELMQENKSNILNLEPLIKEQKATRAAILNQKQKNVNITDKGMKMYIKSSGNELEYINKYCRHTV